MPAEIAEKQKQKNLVAETLVSRLERRLRSGPANMRSHQVEAIQKLITALRNDTYHGLFRHPTGSGKTFLFGEILRAGGVPSLVLVPRRTLIKDTADEFVDDVGHPRKNMKLVDVEEGGNASEILEGILSEPGFANSQNVIIMTYQSFVSIKERSSELFDSLFANINMLICDEAHRSLGEKTKEAILLGQQIRATRTTVGSTLGSPQSKSETSEDPYLRGDPREAVFESEAETLIEELAPDLINLLFTATPFLGKKDVASEYGIPEIHRVTYGELIENGTLIMPREVDLGRALCRTRIEHKDGEQLSDDDLDKITEGFVMEADGRSVYEASIDAYLIEKEKAGGYLPGVAFCRNIDEADKFHKMIDARNKDGGVQVRAVRCTSSNDTYDEGTPSDEARSHLEKNHTDLIITVSKVAEGWNVPTLRCALVLTPMNSPARIIQGIGRIMRSLSPDDEFPPKSEANTCIIQPKWVINGERRSEERIAVAEPAETERTPSGSITPDKPIFESKSVTETLFEADELKLGALSKLTPEVHFNPLKNEMLRNLFGSPRELIKNGRWIDISPEVFMRKEVGINWEIHGSEIVKALDSPKTKDRKPGSLAEKLARKLWPDDFEETKKRIFIPENDDHLKLLIRGPEYLIYDRKGLTDWGNKEFINPEMGWLRLGREIPLQDVGEKERGPDQALALAKWLWPKETEELLRQTPKKPSPIEQGPVAEEVIQRVKNIFSYDNEARKRNPSEEFRIHWGDPSKFPGHTFNYRTDDAPKELKKIKGLEILRSLGLLERGDNPASSFMKRMYQILWPNGFSKEE